MKNNDNEPFMTVRSGSAPPMMTATRACTAVFLAIILCSSTGCGGNDTGAAGFYGGSGSSTANPQLQSIENLDRPGQPLRPGDWSRLRGSGFGSEQGSGYVQFTMGLEKISARLHHSWGDREITCRTPDELQKNPGNSRIITTIQVAVVHTSGSTSNALQSTGDTAPNPNPQPTPPAPSPSPTPSPSPIARFVTSDGSYVDYRCAFSPDDTTIVFERQAVSGSPPGFHLQLVSTAGGTVTPLLTNFKQQSTRPDWSTASNRIAFTASDIYGDTLHIVNPDGSGLEQVAPKVFRTIVDYPYWFPDGKSVAVVDYGTNPVSNYTGIIRRVGIPPEPITVTDLTSPTQVLAGMPSVSPNGRYVALAAQGNVNAPYDQNTNSIYVLDLQAPAGTAPMLFDSGQGRAPSWSPDGTIINFESGRDSTNGAVYCIYAKTFTGSPNDVNVQATRLTDPILNANHCVWSHDGSLLLMSADLYNLPPVNRVQPRGLYVMSAPTSATAGK